MQKRRGPGCILKLFISALLLIALLLGLFFFYPAGINTIFPFIKIESNPPQISFENPAQGFGNEIQAFSVRVQDADSGLDEVIIRAIQGERTKDVLRVEYSSEHKLDDLIKFELGGKDSGFREGDVTIKVTAFDNALFSNPSEQTLNLKVSFGKPRVEVLTAQHNAAQTGVQLVFFRVLNKVPQAVGVLAGEKSYPGFLASKLDPAFQATPDVYCAFVPFPFDFDPLKDKLRAFARDGVGNLATAQINFTLRKRPSPQPKMKLTEDFIKQKAAELLPAFVQLSNTLDGKAPEVNLDPQSEDELITAFRQINESYRTLLNRLIAPIFAAPIEERLWTSPFIRLAGAAPRSVFGERRMYFLNSRDAGGSTHDGIDLASLANSPVPAASGGVVVFADDLGIYGRTVILDHGLGITSLYGHLSTLLVSKGDKVVTGQSVGRTGSTGLAGGDHLHFEIRLHGVPITPIEWWDEKWLKEHIENRIQQMKQVLGIATLPPSK